MWFYECACKESSETPLPPLPTPTPSPAALRLSNGEANQYGLTWLTLYELPFALPEGSQPEVHVDAAPCLLPEISGPRSLRCLLPGAAEAGSVPLLVRLGEQEAAASFRYTPAFDARFARFAALGAGPSAGLQNGALTLDSQLHSLPATLARALGAYFPQALVLPAGVPAAPRLDDLSPSLGALLPNRNSEAWQAFLAAKPRPEALRLAPATPVQNLALPALNGELGPLATAASGPNERFLTQLLRLPAAAETSSWELLQQIAPTVIVLGPELFDTLSALDGEPTLEDEVFDAALAPLLAKLKALPSAPLLLFFHEP